MPTARHCIHESKLHPGEYARRRSFHRSAEGPRGISNWQLAITNQPETTEASGVLQGEKELREKLGRN